MNHRYFTFLAAVCAVTFASCQAAAPQTAPAKTQSAKTQGAVLINATTRNDSHSQTTLLLAENNVATLPIVISPRASDLTKSVAKDMTRILGKMTGATFKVEEGDGKRGIVLGSLTEFPTPMLNKALEIKNGFDGKEAYAIRTRPGKLLLLGATDMGANHAAYRFLREVGCRWFFPSKAWEVIPSESKLQFARDITDRPQMLARSMWFEAGSGSDAGNEDYRMWKLRNGAGESLHVNIGGGGMNAPLEGTQTTHPEYWAARKQPDGSLKRDPGGWQVELANTTVRKMIVDYAVNAFKQHPEWDMVNLEPADTTSHSESPESLAMGSVSDRVFGMANEAARAIEKAYPGQHKMVGLLSYNSYWDPPTFDLEPNVHVQMAWMGQGKSTWDERERLWPQRAKSFGFYDYYSIWAFSNDKLPGSGTNDVRGTQTEMRKKIARGGISVQAESTSSWGSNGRGYYVANALMWNPDLDMDALLTDFYHKAFGAGAPMMKRYYERFDPGSKPFMSGHLMGVAFRDVDEASKVTQNDPAVQARLDQIKAYLRYAQLMWMQEREGVHQDAKIADALYRTIPWALTAWGMIGQSWYNGKKDWPTTGLPTHREIEADFQEGVAHFTPKIRAIGAQVKFSEDLVPVNWPHPPSDDEALKSVKADSYQKYQGAVRYILYSLHGEPLEFTTTAFDAWGGKNHFTITDEKGAELAKGDPKNNATEVHKIVVPKAGRYILDYNDGGSYWEMTVGPGKAVSIPLGQTNDYRNNKVMSDMFFYVPKGVKTIEYYYIRTNFHPGGPHKVVDPSGAIAKNVDVNGDYVTVPVPAGMDGKLWRFRDPVLGFFWFNNVPNYFAASPDALLIPREVAMKDSLALRE